MVKINIGFPKLEQVITDEIVIRETNEDEFRSDVCKHKMPILLNSDISYSSIEKVGHQALLTSVYQFQYNRAFASLYKFDADDEFGSSDFQQFLSS